jgi:hypothetical protein
MAPNLANEIAFAILGECEQPNIDIVAWHGRGGNDARKGKRECGDNDSYIVLQPKDNKRETARVM